MRFHGRSIRHESLFCPFHSMILTCWTVVAQNTARRVLVTLEKLISPALPLISPVVMWRMCMTCAGLVEGKNIAIIMMICTTTNGVISLLHPSNNTDTCL